MDVPVTQWEGKMIRYSVRLLGAGAKGARIGGLLLRDLLEALLEASRGAVRLAVEGRSRAPGAAPAWLTQAADFDVVGFMDGSTILELEELPLGEAVPDRFAQDDLFHPIDPARGAIGLVLESLADAFEGRGDSDRFDHALLDQYAGFGRVLNQNIDAIEMTNSGSSARPITVTRESLETVRRLGRDTPPDQRVRIAGWLDAIRHSDRMFTIKLESGVTLRGVAEGVDPTLMASLFGRKTTVSGVAVFRPSGKILRVDAEHIVAAGADFSTWSVEPVPLFEPPAPGALRVPQGPRSGVNALMGQWPGNETDEEIEELLEGLS